MRGVVQVDIAKGRRELGWEIGYGDLDGATDLNPVTTFTVNNDADFVATRLWAGLWSNTAVTGQSGALPPQVKCQLRDARTGKTYFLQPARLDGIAAMSMGGLAAAAVVGVRPNAVLPPLVNTVYGLPAPIVIRKASSMFVEFTVPAGFTWPGDLYMGLEGFRVYPGQADPIPATIAGAASTYLWNGTITPGALGAGLQKIGTISMTGPGEGRYVLKGGSLTSTVAPSAQATYVPKFEDVALVNVRDSAQQAKQWVRVTNPIPVIPGQVMPASFLTAGGLGLPWAQPRYLDGKDTIFVDVWTDPSLFPGGNVGEVECQFKGVYVPG